MAVDQNADAHASARETIAALSSDELFREAIAPEAPPAEPPAEPAPEPPPAPSGEQPRGADGRWTKPPEQATQAPAAATQQPPAGASPVPGTPDEEVPSWRHREIREQRDQLEQRSRQLEAALLDQQRQFQALRQQIEQAKPKEPEPIPDVITDPNAYYAHLQQGFDSRLRNMEANFSFRLAHQAHGELFEHAYGEMIGRAERGDPSVARSVMASPDPGAAMVNWYRRESTLARVGGDPDTWARQQWLTEQLKDPKFQGEMLELLRNGARQQAPAANGGAPVRLPPSLNRMAGVAPAHDQTGDMNDASLFDYAFR